MTEKTKRKNEQLVGLSEYQTRGYTVALAWLSIYILIGLTIAILWDMLDDLLRANPSWMAWHMNRLFDLLKALILGVVGGTLQRLHLQKIFAWEARYWILASTAAMAVNGILAILYPHIALIPIGYLIVTIAQSFILRNVLRKPWLWTAGNIVIVIALSISYAQISTILSDHVIGEDLAYLLLFLSVLILGAVSLLLAGLLLSHLFKRYRQDVPELSKAKREAAA